MIHGLVKSCMHNIIEMSTHLREANVNGESLCLFAGYYDHLTGDFMCTKYIKE
jgi:hypothetical protein